MYKSAAALRITLVTMLVVAATGCAGTADQLDQEVTPSPGLRMPPEAEVELSLLAKEYAKFIYPRFVGEESTENPRLWRERERSLWRERERSHRLQAVLKRRFDLCNELCELGVSHEQIQRVWDAAMGSVSPAIRRDLDFQRSLKGLNEIQTLRALSRDHSARY